MQIPISAYDLSKRSFFPKKLSKMLSRLAGPPTRYFSTTFPLMRLLPPEVGSQECSYPIAGKKTRYVDLKNAFNDVKSGDHIFVHGIAATPTPLLEDRIRSNSLFTGANLRKAVNDGTADFNSVFLQEIPQLFRSGAIKLNVALIHVSPPDSNGYCTLGTSIDTTRAAVTQADYIIGKTVKRYFVPLIILYHGVYMCCLAMSNKNMPRTFGDSLIHESHIDVMVECDDQLLHERPVSGAASAEEKKIGEIIANNLVEDGATLQMGRVRSIGAIPDAALAAMTHHKDLGIHTEMFSDGVLDLVECNAITNAKKLFHPGKKLQLVVSFVYGSTRLYKYLDDNPSIYFGDCQWVNDPTIIRTMPKMTAINSAVEMGEAIVADSIGPRFLSGFGGQVDFIRGAAIGDDGRGKPIIALSSITKKGVSKIVPFINEGAGVVTSRAHVHYLVTENGVAQLWGKNMRQRAYELIKIAHPSKREELEKAAFERLHTMPSPD
ncbi:unnamed protein product [Enterobius vermicularis]|uniref:Acetyl-CoA hydrolase n=1 Tax=Enterobius vermicularis TaxID=51028 RepID=A0A0N4V8I8_ENTVE|nr:unnamed protein product [Enterobius vermicularis]